MSPLCRICAAAVQQLGIRASQTDVCVAGIGGTKAGRASSGVQIVISSCMGGEKRLRVNLLVMPNTTSNSPSQDVLTTNWQLLEHLPLADPQFGKSGAVDILLGAIMCAKVFQHGMMRMEICWHSAQCLDGL